MDLINNTTTVNTNPDAETETPPPPSLLPPPPHTTQLINNNSLSFTNGSVLKRHKSSAVVVQVSYKECLKNHAASLGGHALDGCGEFMPSPTSTPTDPTSLKCAACGCHRNFHRREPDEPTTTTHFLRFHHHPSPHRRSNSSSPSPSPPPPPQPQPQPPPSSTYYSSAPHMLLALSTAVSGPSDDYNPSAANQNSAIAIKSSTDQNPSGKKRNRTKFSQEQKEKMYAFSEKLGWKMQKSEEGVVEDFCNEIGVRKGVLKVWMHNNKYTFSKRDSNYNNSTLNGSSSNNGTTGDIRINSFDTNGGSHSPINGTNISSISHHHHHGHPHHHHHNNEGTTNGSSSSS